MIFVPAVLMLIAGYTVTGSRYPYYNTDDWPLGFHKTWMRGLANHTMLSRLSVPGTHQSLSFYGGDAVQCQSWSLLDQLNAGIRYVDVRCRLYQDHIYVYHDTIYQHTDLLTVLQTTQEFLQKNPSEVILMRVRDEDPFGETNSTMSFADAFLQTISSFPKSLIWKRYYTPSLRTSRGKIVLLRDFHSTPILGIFYHRLKIKDDWYVKSLFTSRISAKWNGAREHLERARSDRRSYYTYLTYISGSGFWAFPYSVAYRVNFLCLEYLKRIGKGRLGILAMDYPGEELIKRIIDSNTFVENP